MSRTVFERLPHLEDEVTYLFQARIYARGHLVIESPEPDRAYWQPFVVDNGGNRFGKYTPGWPAMLAAGVILGQSWVINAFLAALITALTYRMGREIFTADVGLIAAMLTAFSPMALLLNASLMGHTAALFAALLFMYAYWRIEQGRQGIRWGLAAGIGLGLLVINRPLSAVAVAAPFIIWSLFRITLAWRFGKKPAVLRTLHPLIALAGVTLLISTAIPIYSLVAVGDPTTNLYTLVWEYDKVGFGEGYGRNGHTLEKGIRHARFDLSLMAADLFGWNVGTITSEIQQHLLTEDGYWPLLGLSWVLLIPGLVAGARRRWTWLLAAVTVSVIAVQLAYWIGSQRYSTRYYFESLSALALISGLALAWLTQRVSRWIVYVPLTAVLIYSLYNYTTPRIEALRGFNFINQAKIDSVLARRDGDQPILVIMSGTDMRWRSAGALMAVTSPYLDSDIVVAMDNQFDGVREQILARFPDRQIIEMQASGNESWFPDELPVSLEK